MCVLLCMGVLGMIRSNEGKRANGGEWGTAKKRVRTVYMLHISHGAHMKHSPLILMRYTHTQMCGFERVL